MRADTLVLCYHAVSDTWPASLAIAPGTLEDQLRRLLDRGYRGATFSEAVSSAGEGRILAVTFDDAYRSTIDRGLPILVRLGIPGTVFVPSAHVGSSEPMAWPGIDRWLGTPHEQELACMGRAELGELVQAGWELGSHTHTHPHLTDLAEEEMVGELTLSRERLEALAGAPCRSIAYPYGAVSPTVAEAAAAAGYQAGATLRPDRYEKDPLLWPRVGVFREDPPWRFAVKTAPMVRRVALARLRHPSNAPPRHR